jgi:succinyl-diaminopimelate desuccinylase
MEDYSDHSYPASSCDPDGEMSGIIQDNVEALAGYRPVPIFSLGGSDSRYWRNYSPSCTACRSLNQWLHES